MKELGAHRGEEIAARLERLGLAPGDDRQLARCRALGATADRRVEHHHAARGQLFGHAPQRERIDRAHAHDDVTAAGGPDESALARDDGFRLRGRLDHHDRALGGGRDVLRRLGDLRAALAQRGDLGGIDVVNDQREATLGEIERHRSSHVAEPDESDGSRHVSLLYARLGDEREEYSRLIAIRGAAAWRQATAARGRSCRGPCRRCRAGASRRR